MSFNDLLNSDWIPSLSQTVMNSVWGLIFEPDTSDILDNSIEHYSFELCTYDKARDHLVEGATYLLLP